MVKPFLKFSSNENEKKFRYTKNPVDIDNA